MSDVFTPAKRSAVMALIRGKGNKATELRMIALFRSNGITGWRRNHPIFGKPDFVFKRERIAIFVDGCFWHCCPKHSNIPSKNREFWEPKLGKNKIRDRLVSQTLRFQGWRVLRFWEHDLSVRNAPRVVRRLERALKVVAEQDVEQPS